MQSKDPQPQQTLSFAEAVQRLGLSEFEMSKLVSEGEILAFRDGAEMRFRVGDVESLKHDILYGGGTVRPGSRLEAMGFCSFEHALAELQLSATELKRLVSDGEILAFRDGDSMKFRTADIEAMKGDPLQQGLILPRAHRVDEPVTSEFCTFEQALRRLDLGRNELRRLVSEGEIRAFRDGAEMNFRVDEVESLGRTLRDEEEHP